ncbi:hypothetical protein L218DRAFT_949295 [Marasmius fiardii PR-910]|nr:hypothetical protein L218DRAFT_949295 [Marasmius fiardii PR-910]
MIDDMDNWCQKINQSFHNLSRAFGGRLYSQAGGPMKDQIRGFVDLRQTVGTLELPSIRDVFNVSDLHEESMHGSLSPIVMDISTTPVRGYPITGTGFRLHGHIIIGHGMVGSKPFTYYPGYFHNLSLWILNYWYWISSVWTYHNRGNRFCVYVYAVVDRSETRLGLSCFEIDRLGLEVL